MIRDLPTYISLTFGLTTFATLLLFVWSIRKSNATSVQKLSMSIFGGLASWLTIQAILSLSNIYNTNPSAFPPKIILFGIMPPILAITLLFCTKRGRQFIESLPIIHLTYLNMVRVPIELVLYFLFLNNAIPELMTFTGRNFDIVAGITAPCIAYFGIKRAILSRKIIILWNYCCLGLLINIVINALFSAPSSFQQFAFQQPNIAILNFPFSWLPTFVVPIVLFGHLVSLHQLQRSTN